MSAGPLPEAGGLLDQSVWLMDAFQVLASIQPRDKS